MTFSNSQGGRAYLPPLVNRVKQQRKKDQYQITGEMIYNGTGPSKVDVLAFSLQLIFKSRDDVSTFDKEKRDHDNHDNTLIMTIMMRLMAVVLNISLRKCGGSQRAF